MAALSGLVVILILLSDVLPASASGPLMVGVLKADSLVIPVFLYENGRWFPIQDGTGSDSALSLANTTITWYSSLIKPCYGPFSYGSEEAPVAFQTGAAVDFFAGGYGLRVISDISGAALGGPCIDRVVTSPRPVPVLPLVDLRDDAFRWNQFLDLVLPRIDELEEEAVIKREHSSSPDPQGRPATIPERRHSAPVFLSLLQTFSGDFVFYCLERTYRLLPTEPDPTCYLTTVAEGWLLGDEAGHYELLDPRIMLSTCDKKEVTSLAPLGTLALDGHNLLIARFDGYESRQEAVIELTNPPRVIATGHGQGPRE